MYKQSWGQKRVCPCNKIKYYDLGREKLECPECGKEIEVVNLTRPRRGRKPGSINLSNIKPQVQEKPKKAEDNNLDIENVEVEINETNIEDDSVLLEDDNDVDPTVDAGIKPVEEKEDS